MTLREIRLMKNDENIDKINENSKKKNYCEPQIKEIGKLVRTTKGGSNHPAYDSVEPQEVS